MDTKAEGASLHIKGATLFLLVILIGCGGGGGDSSGVTQPPVAETAKVLAANDLGIPENKFIEILYGAQDPDLGLGGILGDSFQDSNSR